MSLGPWLLGIGGAILLIQIYLVYRSRHMIVPTAMLIADKLGIDPLVAYEIVQLKQDVKEYFKRKRAANTK